MNDPHVEKAEAQKAKMKAKYDEFIANIKEAGADGKIFMKDKIEDLKALMS